MYKKSNLRVPSHILPIFSLLTLTCPSSQAAPLEAWVWDRNTPTINNDSQVSGASATYRFIDSEGVESLDIRATVLDTNSGIAWGDSDELFHIESLQPGFITIRWELLEPDTETPHTADFDLMIRDIDALRGETVTVHRNDISAYSLSENTNIFVNETFDGNISFSSTRSDNSSGERVKLSYLNTSDITITYYREALAINPIAKFTHSFAPEEFASPVVQDIDSELDSDGDGLTDRREGTSDSDGDGVIDMLDRDCDNDGLIDSREIVNGKDIDSDNDGVVDRLDLDSDNDGLTDIIEIGFEVIDDTDGDGRIDNFQDADVDGLDDRIDGSLPPRDTNSNDIADKLELDSDGDGLLDLAESSDIATTLDSNNDGRIDNTNDGDGDGLFDVVDGNIAGVVAPINIVPTDTDNDGIPDFQELDSDGDGINDTPVAVINNPPVVDGAVPPAVVSANEAGSLRSAVDGGGSYSVGWIALFFVCNFSARLYRRIREIV